MSAQSLEASNSEREAYAMDCLCGKPLELAALVRVNGKPDRRSRVKCGNCGMMVHADRHAERLLPMTDREVAAQLPAEYLDDFVR